MIALELVICIVIQQSSGHGNIASEKCRRLKCAIFSAAWGLKQIISGENK